MPARQFARYALVGIIGMLVQLGILAACVELLKLDPMLGTSVGFIIALLLQYALNHRWTFRSKRSHKSSLWRYIVVSLSGFALNFGMMAMLIDYFHIWYIAAQVSVIAVVPLFNFVLNRYWAFSHSVDKPQKFPK